MTTCSLGSPTLSRFIRWVITVFATLGLLSWQKYILKVFESTMRNTVCTACDQGGANLTAALRIPDRLIRGQGVWKSETSKNTYIKETKDTLFHISRKCTIQGFSPPMEKMNIHNVVGQEKRQ